MTKEGMDTAVWELKIEPLGKQMRKIHGKCCERGKETKDDLDTYIHDNGDSAARGLVIYLMLNDKDMPASYARGQPDWSGNRSQEYVWWADEAGVASCSGIK